jgi:uncharacterized protein YbjQ (UPF0145 family)
MPFWRPDTEREKREKEEQSAAVAALEKGDIPPKARRRIEEHLNSKQGLFTSDLSALEFLLAREVQVEPISQVFGVSVFSVSALAMASFGTVGIYSRELGAISDAARDARRAAVSRMQMEAQLLGASGVIGVEVLSKKSTMGNQMKEYTVIGTAVKIPGWPSNRPSFTSTLNGSEFWQLIKAGYQPLSVVSGQSCYYISPSWSENYLMRPAGSGALGIGSFSNQELFECTSEFITARELAMSRLQEELRMSGGDGVVDVDVDYEIEHTEYEGSSTSSRRVALQVSFNIMGTAIQNPTTDNSPVIQCPILIQDLASGKGEGVTVDLEDM